MKTKILIDGNLFATAEDAKINLEQRIAQACGDTRKRLMFAHKAVLEGCHVVCTYSGYKQ